MAIPSLRTLEDQLLQGAMKNRDFRNAVEALAFKQFEEEKRNFINKVENHPISQEIMMGPDAIAGGPVKETLGGKTEGNLFSFLGFFGGENPITLLKRELVEKIRFIKAGYTANSYRWKISVPEAHEIGLTTKGAMSWLKRSWVYALEHGVTGLHSYITSAWAAKRNRRFGARVVNNIERASRSGRAIELKDKNGRLIKLRDISFHGVKYYTSLLKSLKIK
jgi:hypothetical protein